MMRVQEPTIAAAVPICWPTLSPWRREITAIVAVVILGPKLDFGVEESSVVSWDK